MAIAMRFRWRVNLRSFDFSLEEQSAVNDMPRLLIGLSRRAKYTVNAICNKNARNLWRAQKPLGFQTYAHSISVEPSA